MDNHVKIEGGKYTMNIRQGVEIGLSERLFEYYKNCMNATNEQISTKKLMIYKGQLIERQIKSGKKLKSGAAETSGSTNTSGSPSPNVKVTNTWYAYIIELNDQETRSLYAYGMFGGGTGALCIPHPYVRAVSAAIALTCGLHLQLYTIYGKNKGITIWIPAYQPTNLPVAFVTFN
jgi:hypothetical protein